MESSWVEAEFADFCTLLQANQTRNSPFFWVTHKSLKIFLLGSFLSHIFYLSINLTCRDTNVKQERRNNAFFIQYADLHSVISFLDVLPTPSSAVPSCPETISCLVQLLYRVEESGHTK